MSGYSGAERRRHSRMSANFIVSYRVRQVPDNYDLSQSKNVSQGGMMLTTNKKFENGTHLAMTIRFPFVSQKIRVLAEVVDSNEIVRNLIYETRIKFLDLDEEFFRKMGDFVNKHMKKYMK